MLPFSFLIAEDFLFFAREFFFGFVQGIKTVVWSVSYKEIES
jgi:hypothetical protein